MNKTELLQQIHKSIRFEINREHTMQLISVASNPHTPKHERLAAIHSIISDRDDSIKYLDEAVEYIKRHNVIHAIEGLSLYVVSGLQSWETLVHIYRILSILDNVDE